MKFLATILFVFLSFSSFAQVQPKLIDGLFDDWSASDFTINDEDDNEQGLDILNVSVSNDAERLYLLIETNRDFDLQDAEDLTLFIDADNDPTTGFARGGIGAEFTYYFEVKNGYINQPDGSSSRVNYEALGIIAAPTFTSDKFEIVINRSVEYDGRTTLMDPVISILIENDSSGDQVPDTSGGFEYKMNDSTIASTHYNLNKDPEHTRFMTYNVKQDGFFKTDQQEQLRRVITAMNPDVIAFQEVYDMDASDIVSRLNDWIPNSGAMGWQAAKVFPDVIVCTRWYMEAYDKIDGNGVFLTYDKTGQNPLIIYNVHLPCCDNDEERQTEIDHLLSILRDKESSPEIGFSYPDNAPVIITGDFNLVGLSQNYSSLINGDIVDNDNYGQDFNPDWDGTTLEDANPYITGYPANYTWSNPEQSYIPGKLDFVFYTGSVMPQRNSFVFDSERLSFDALNQLNIARDETTLASDHLPVIVDFTLGPLKDNDGDSYTSDEDCDDNDPAINPAATEIPNNTVDENCDGIILIIDADNDGFNSDEDCDDSNPMINPDAIEIPNNQVDENCDGILLIIDEDMDGYNSDEDCDDSNPAINPGETESCDGIDNNCDGNIDEGVILNSYYMDRDNDGYGDDATVVMGCSAPLGAITQGGDCDDSDPNINPAASELCDGSDNNCNGSIDEGLTVSAYYMDVDMDGYGDVSSVVMACSAPSGLIAQGGDCDDTDPTINPTATEIANNDIDENCDGELLVIDVDMDGYNSDEDCDDNNPEINPGQAEIANNLVDENCDGEILIIDEDMDGYNSDEDCDDNEPIVNPGQVEIPNNNIDENCDGEILIIDEDMDGFNSDEDCDDNNDEIYPGAVEIANNGIDEDCDGGDQTTSIFELDGLSLHLYPNPVSDLLKIRFDKDTACSIAIYNSKGQLIHQSKESKAEIDINTSRLIPGLYFVKIETAKRQFTDRIIVL